MGRKKDENTQQLEIVRDFLRLVMHFSDSIKMKYHPYNKHRVFLTGVNSVSTGQGHRRGGKVSWLVSDNRDNLPCRTESTRPVSSCLLTKPDSAFVGIRLCTDVSALQKSGPLSDKEQKYLEISNVFNRSTEQRAPEV